MRTRWTIIWILILGVWAAAETVQAADIAAEQLMEEVRLSMPGVPLELDASIRVLNPNGRTVKTIRAGALLTPQEGGRTARYRLFDGFGSVLEEMTVTLGEGAANFEYAKGDPPQSAPLPDLFGRIEGSEMSWMDLSFSYFWWPGPRIVGAEKVANRWDCQIIEIDCPEEYREQVKTDSQGGGGNPWSHIRLWVVPAYHAVVRGEAWRGGAAVKRFDVHSVKKLRKVYMIGDMEVRNLETGARAKLKVGKMKMLSPDYTPEELEQFNAPVEW